MSFMPEFDELELDESFNKPINPSSVASNILTECNNEIEQHRSQYGSVPPSVESLMDRLSTLSEQISRCCEELSHMNSSTAGGDDRRVAWYIHDDLSEMNKLKYLLLVNLVKHE